VGQTLTATPATWPVSGASTFAWSVGGQPAGTGTSYQLKPADTGKTVTVTETRTSTGSADGTSTSTATGAVAPATTSLSVDAPAKVKKGHRAKITVTLAASGVTPTGMVKVSFAGKKLSGQLVNGVVTISLPKVARPGHKKLVVSYVPDTGFTAATKTLMIRVPHRG
jgi:hypothetical protein